MTLQDCKNKIAAENGYPVWGNVLVDLQEGNISYLRVDALEDQAAELYAKHKAMDFAHKVAINGFSKEGSFWEDNEGSQTTLENLYTHFFERKI